MDEIQVLRNQMLNNKSRVTQSQYPFGRTSTIKAFIHNDSLLPPHYETQLLFLYFFNLSEYYNNGFRRYS